MREISVEHVHSPCLLSPRVYCADSSKAFERRTVTIERTACVDKVNRVGRRRWKRSSVALLAAANTTSTKRMVWAFIVFRGTRNFCLLVGYSATLIAARKLWKFVEKIQTIVNERSMEQRSAVAKTRKFPPTCCRVRHFRGRLVMPKKNT